MKNPSVITISHVTKHFRHLIAVNDVSMTIHEGDIYGLLGPNGAGKTTTVSILLGLVAATSGTVEVLCKPVTPHNNSVLRHVGALIGARPAYFPYISGYENVKYVADMFGVGKKRVEEVMEFMGIADAGDRLPDLYSTGMKQRLGIAMAIVHKPKLLILDEPTNGMDPPGMIEIRGLIKDLAKQGITILLSSHLLHEVEQVCNRVAVFNHGKVVAEGTIKELQGDSKNIQIHTQHVQKTLQLLSAVQGITCTAKDDGIIEIYGIPSDQLIEALVKHNITPQQVYMKGNSLEDLFLQLIEEKI